MKKEISLILFLILSTILGQEAEQPLGSGSNNDPFKIANLNNLIWVSQNYANFDSAYYVQQADINASVTQYWDDLDEDNDGNPYNDVNDVTFVGNNEGFSPIGESYSKRFIGNYNAYGHKIDSLFINRVSDEFVGLFGWISSSTVDSLSLSNLSVVGNKYVGGVVGFNDNSSSVNKCSASGEVSGENFIGGLVGYCGASKVKNSYSTVTVVGENSVGGLLGRSFSSIIKNSFSTGIVIGESDVGGLLGGNVKNIFASKLNISSSRKDILGIDGSSLVENCYSRGNVKRASNSRSSRVGSFCGFNNDTIRYCYTVNDVSYINQMAPSSNGFVGNDSSGIYINNFWNSSASNQSVGVGATAQSTESMKNRATFTNAGWDFKGEQINGIKDIWEIGGSKNDGYPYFSWQKIFPTPVELRNFSAKVVGGAVMLRWETATEVNNYGFEIQRQTTTPQLTYRWEKLGFREGHGNSNFTHEYSFLDVSIPLATNTLKYRLKQIDSDGNYKYSDVISVIFKEKLKFKFYQNYPNPFNATTIFTFTILNDGLVTLIIYNAIGQKVTELVSKELSVGRYSFVWNTSQFGNISSGVYFARLTAGSHVKTQKVVLLK